jgi:hypothetical protein
MRTKGVGYLTLGFDFEADRQGKSHLVQSTDLSTTDVHEYTHIMNRSTLYSIGTTLYNTPATYINITI